MVRWIAWIQLFDFKVKHVPGKKHTAANGLSRRGATPEEMEQEAEEENIDDFIEAQLESLQVVPPPDHDSFSSDISERSQPKRSSFCLSRSTPLIFLINKINKIEFFFISTYPAFFTTTSCSRFTYYHPYQGQ